MNWVNFDDVLAQLRTSGLIVDPERFPNVGARVRCRVDGDQERRGWYHLHELQALDGTGLLLVGSYGVWRGNDPGTVRIQLKGRPLSTDQRAALRERMARDAQIEGERRRRLAQTAAKRAERVWLALSEHGRSEYLDRKGVQAFGVRFSPTGTLAIPMLDGGGMIHGLQVIYPPGHRRAKQLGRNKDFFPKGVAKQGTFFLIGSPRTSNVVLLVEGYATGASLHMATGLPVAVCWDAGNLVHAAKVLAARYRHCKALVCADDDYLAKCRACGQLTGSTDPVCTHCGAEHRGVNAGLEGAKLAALAVDGAWVTPLFLTPRPRDRKGATDFNDLHATEGLHGVRSQIEARLSALNWRGADEPPGPPQTGAGGGDDDALTVLVSPRQLSDRFSLVYEMSETVFDAAVHKLVPLSSMRNLCASRRIHREWLEGLDKRVVLVDQVGFDPTERDERIKCNLWGGWPTKPAAGDCSKLLELGEYLCSEDPRRGDLWNFVLRWLAYPIQHPGAKMKSALVFHGPQGTGKNVFFEAYMRIFGEYGRVIDQKALEDKFNDTFSRKLFLVADEVVARQELYHTKNDLKHLITGTEIRVNPKNVGAYFERNHMNLVFLSNEPVPMVLERDDRRYCVIWTPPKLEQTFYRAVKAEIEAGGVAALHDYLLNLELGDFDEATQPPMSDAKRELIEVSLDSSERFWREWIKGELPLPVGPVISMQLYEAYRYWCGKQGVMKPAQLSTMVTALSKTPGAFRNRPRHFKEYSRTVETQSTVIWPPADETGRRWDREISMADLSDHLAAFSTALTRWTKPAREREPAGGAAAADEDQF